MRLLVRSAKVSVTSRNDGMKSVKDQSEHNPALLNLDFLAGEWDMELSKRHSCLVATTPLMGTSCLSGLKTVHFW